MDWSNLGVEQILGLIYVSAWSISMYSPIWENIKCRSSKGVSLDFAVLNTTGYFYLLLSLYIQMFYWIPATDIAISTQHKMVSPDSTVPLSPANLPPLESPKLTMFDLFYCFHGEIMNLVIMSQLIYGRTLWKFADDRYRRMKPLYFKIWTFSVFLFLIITFQFLWDNKVEQHWDNARTLQYCNKLFILKITMSLIKYIPQVKHNRDRKSVKGFSISGVMLDITGGVASVLQLLWQLGHAEDGFTWMVLVLNFGKIGLSMVTLTFCSVFIGQWLAYGDV